MYGNNDPEATARYLIKTPRPAESFSWLDHQTTVFVAPGSSVQMCNLAEV